MIGKIIEVIEEARETKTIRIKLPEKIKFQAGQFVFLFADIMKNGKTKETKRAFSISSSPKHQDYIEVTFNRIPGGELSPVLYELKKGDNIKIEGPYGRFICNPGTHKDIVFIAGGTGIAPLMGMARCILDSGTKTKITMLYSVKTPEDIAYKNELLDLEKRKKISLGITVTRPDGHSWKGHTGRINSEFLKENMQYLPKHTYFLCGPLPFIQTMIDLLKQENVPADNIKIEPWK